jgi:hypothetical protein
MAQTISNIKEDSLLVWLDNSLEKTQNELDSQNFSISFWSGEYKNFPIHNHMSETDVNDIIHQSELRITALSYRLNWIHQQIENLKK